MRFPPKCGGIYHLIKNNESFDNTGTPLNKTSLHRYSFFDILLSLRLQSSPYTPCYCKIDLRGIPFQRHMSENWEETFWNSDEKESPTSPTTQKFACTIVAKIISPNHSIIPRGRYCVCWRKSLFLMRYDIWIWLFSKWCETWLAQNFFFSVNRTIRW